MQQKALDNDIAGGLQKLAPTLKGDIYTDRSSLLQYATDASAYREVPAAIVRPACSDDIKKLILFARENGFPLIPRTAGTSLAGQVVGPGIIADVSKYMTRILEINPKERWVRVEPGVVPDELNNKLEPFGLFFGPETSTSNRCMIGGMVGNNSCGAHSLVYGSTREHVISVKALLSDGSEAEFGPLSREEFEEKLHLPNLEGEIYRNIHTLLSDPENSNRIKQEFPDPSVERRNTGYAIDILLDTEIFSESTKKFNFCKLLAGSEGTLAFLTEIKLNLVELPPPVKGLVCIHCNSLEEAFRGNLVALKHRPVAVELMDNIVLEQTKANLTQRKNRFFLQGDPAAILIVEFEGYTQEEITGTAARMEADFRAAGYGYHFPLLFGSDIPKVWALRKAGLGLLSNIPGDARPVAVTEDTAVNPQVLPEYMAEFNAMLQKYGLSCVYYAHIATGELHLRPVLNLKDPKDVKLFHTVALETARLVKKYRGSLSGEHGDGRLRGEFIPLMIGESNYRLLKEIKQTWDPHGIFNPGKITDTPPMNTFLRYDPGVPEKEITTIFDFSEDLGILRSAEKCNGSGDCRKSEIFGGTMCPSYQATRDENATTRARANILREFLTRSSQKNPFDHREIYEIMDLCLSCKGCKSECPSSVDMAKLKAEFLQHYYDAHGIPFRTRVIAYISHLNKLAMVFPVLANFIFENALTSSILKKIIGFAPERSIPLLYKYTLKAWYRKHYSTPKPSKGTVNLFCDEFTNFNDTWIGISAIRLLTALGYEVVIPRHTLSGRTFISKGLIRKAQKLARKNITLLKDIVTPEMPLLGIEPSGILAFRDEYPDLAGKELKDESKKLAASCLMVDEFIAREFEKGNITADMFTDAPLKVKLHGHCQQKSVASTRPTVRMLSIPANYSVTEMKTGCCGMAGSFGYEKEHYDLSMKVGELVLFPEIRKTDETVVVAAPGTSCRHQIKDGTGRKALHPVEILYDALKKK
ncbi:MAG: FAD-binding protein [Bacteroidales bacterium]|nr:FAD-binding protein [Bacteroidales bacterium]